MENLEVKLRVRLRKRDIKKKVRGKVVKVTQYEVTLPKKLVEGLGLDSKVGKEITLRLDVD